MANDSTDREITESVESLQIPENTNENVQSIDPNTNTEDSNGINPVIIWV